MAPFNVSAFVLKQKYIDLYLFGMNSRILREVCYVTPMSENDPLEVQRLLSESRAKEIGSYIREETSILPNAIVVSLTDEVQIRPSGRSNEVIVEFPSTTGKFMYVLDGQHRLEGFKHSDGIEFDLPVVGLHDADRSLRGRVFADINSKQVKVSKVHLLTLLYNQDLDNADGSATMSVVQLLAESPDSPLRNKVKLYDGQSGTWVTNDLLKRCLAPYTESGGPLYSRSVASQAKVIKEYLKAVARTWPAAWGNNKEYLLTRPVGIEIMLGILERVMHRCVLNEGSQYTADTFSRQLLVLRDFKLQSIEGITLPLDWVRGSHMGRLSSGAQGREQINKQLKNALYQADENEADA